MNKKYLNKEGLTLLWSKIKSLFIKNRAVYITLTTDGAMPVVPATATWTKTSQVDIEGNTLTDAEVYDAVVLRGAEVYLYLASTDYPLGSDTKFIHADVDRMVYEGEIDTSRAYIHAHAQFNDYRVLAGYSYDTVSVVFNGAILSRTQGLIYYAEQVGKLMYVAQGSDIYVQGYNYDTGTRVDTNVQDAVGALIDESEEQQSLISTTWSDITDSELIEPNSTRYTGKEIHCIANDVDASLSDNGISSTQYAGMYVQDGEKNNVGKCAVDFYNTGMVEMQLYAQNKGTGSNVSNYLALQVANDGTRSISVNAPGAWRNAIGYTAGSNVSVNNNTGVISATDTKATLKTSTPSSFTTKTISNSEGWTNLGSYKFTPGLYLVIFAVRWGAKSAGYRKICLSKTSTGGSVSNSHIVMGPASPSDITVQNLTFAVNPTEDITYYFNVSQYHSSTTTSIEAQGRYTIIQLA